MFEKSFTYDFIKENDLSLVYQVKAHKEFMITNNTR